MGHGEWDGEGRGKVLVVEGLVEAPCEYCSTWSFLYALKQKKNRKGPDSLLMLV